MKISFKFQAGAGPTFPIRVLLDIFNLFSVNHSIVMFEHAVSFIWKVTASSKEKGDLFIINVKYCSQGDLCVPCPWLEERKKKGSKVDNQRQAVNSGVDFKGVDKRGDQAADCGVDQGVNYAVNQGVYKRAHQAVDYRVCWREVQQIFKYIIVIEQLYRLPFKS